jgi:segregation and condensation protein A
MAYKVQLDVFEGPLDLLLHLVRENQVDIYDIPIALITEQYLHYLDMMESLNLDVAGDYLVMAATLTYIKSKMLLPAAPDEGEEEEDPRRELVDRLLEYQEYRKAMETFRERERDQMGVFSRGTPDEVPKIMEEEPEEESLGEVSAFDLLKAFEKILAEIGATAPHVIQVDEMETAERLIYVLDRLGKAEGTTFSALFEGMAQRIEIVATFLALLELVRRKLVQVSQAKSQGTLYIRRKPENE